MKPTQTDTQRQLQTGEAERIQPGLYVVATPIGNARDITLRALDTLKMVDCILAEDTRVTAKLLAIHSIKRPMLPLHDHNEGQMCAQILARIRGGDAIALVSDAGTPLVSDPGYKLVRAAIEADLMVTHLPGASSVLTALVVSALPPDRFLFCGFLPPKSSERRSVLDSLARIPSSLVFFESGPRLAASLVDLAGALGPRAASVSRELTKKFEETVRGPLDQLASDYAARDVPKGEIVIVVGPPAPVAAPDAQTLDAALLAALAEHSLAQAAASVADAFGIPKREAYERALALTGKKTNK